MIQYGFGKTPFGPTFIAIENGQVLRLSFVSQKYLRRELKQIEKLNLGVDLRLESSKWAQTQLDKLIPKRLKSRKQILTQLKPQGTLFQKKVWMALTEIPFGKTANYADIAKKIGHPKAVRAVGSAVGANPIGYLIPCHRVLPKSGGLGQFGWGPELKEKMLKSEGAI